MSTAGGLGSLAQMRGKSMFGDQVASHRRTAPAHGFGSSTRAHADKIFAGGLAAAKRVGHETPGPRYNLPHHQGQRYSFGTAERFGVPDRFADMTTTASPGPGAYDHNMAGSVGKQVYSTSKTFPRYGFGTGDRAVASKVFISPKHAESGNFGMTGPGPAFGNKTIIGSPEGSKWGFGTDGRFTREQRQLSDAADTPGPGTYSSDNAQVWASSSREVKQPSFGFGTSNREHMAKVFVSNVHAGASGGAFVYSPGPASYRLNSSIGNQTSTRGRTAPTWGFAKANRFRDKYDTGTPGPGAYAI